ncbi:hypothetical protein EII17_10335 [Clostridiales bacterium COT073_COT-073]|nr:hypothetical protein EII17_10335 [Clostridiales bacterium COT073_COT-073]
MEFWNSMDPTAKKYIMIVVGFMILYAIGVVIYMKQKKNKTAKWLANNPTAAKVYIVNNSNLVRSNGLQINSVDGQIPVTFVETTKTGFYLLPGTHVVESTFTTTRPGVMYRNVSTTYGPTKQELTVEANKTYHYSFDRKNETYEFTEV